MLGILLTLCLVVTPARGDDPEPFAAARQLFYDATRESRLVDEAVERYETIKTQESAYTHRADAYLGALKAVRGKHAFLPHNKFIWAMRGLKDMDRALDRAPEDLEVLFIHAAVCHHLPFFFGRNDDARQDFRTLLARLPHDHHKHDRQLVIDIFKLIQKSRLTEAEKHQASQMRVRLGYGEGVAGG